MLGHALLGLGVLTAGAGSYLFYAGGKTIDEHNASATYDEYIATLGDVGPAQQKQKLGLAVIGGGVALIGGGILYYVLHSRSDAESLPPVQATVSAEAATITFMGTF